MGYVSGQFPLRDGRIVHPVVDGGEVDLECVCEACTVAADNVPAQIAAVTDGLS